MNLTMDKNGIVLLLFINTAIATVNLIVRVMKKDYQKAFVTSTLILICPVVGPAYLFFSWLVYHLVFKHQADELNLHELSMSKEKIKVIQKPDAEVAMNIVPFEEAFIVSDHSTVRRFLLDALKQNRYGSVQQILNAVGHKDGEVAHYAAAAITEIIDEFFTNEKILRTEMYEEKSLEACLAYLDYVYSYLSEYILSSNEQKHFLVHFEEAVAYIEKYFKDEITGELYFRVVNLWVDFGAVEAAYPWVKKAFDSNEHDLDSYKAGLKYYYAAQKHEEFLSLLEELKKSDVDMDYETVEIVRFLGN